MCKVITLTIHLPERVSQNTTDALTEDLELHVEEEIAFYLTNQQQQLTSIDVNVVDAG